MFPPPNVTAKPIAINKTAAITIWTKVISPQAPVEGWVDTVIVVVFVDSMLLLSSVE